MKFKVLKKEFFNGSGLLRECVTTEIVEAYRYETPDQCLIFYTKNDDLVKVFAPGIWIEIEPEKEEES